MATRFISKLTLALLSIPFIVISRIWEFLNIGNLRSDLILCLQAVDSITDQIPKKFIVALISAEDRRSLIHCGVDPIAMARALFVRVKHGEIQGASTIEQQFVRVVSKRYERSLRRKIREQALAIALSRRRNKNGIAAAYLAIAFFGSRYHGMTGLKKRHGDDLGHLDMLTVFGVIARLKYPEPIHPSEKWLTKIDRRIQYIGKRIPTS